MDTAYTARRSWIILDAPMLTRTIPSSGEALPVIGLGTYKGFDVGSSSNERAALGDVLRNLFSLGGSLLDSSPMYGRAEEVAGDLVAEQHAREKSFVATKVWTQGRAAGIDQLLATGPRAGQRQNSASAACRGFRFRSRRIEAPRHAILFRW